MSEQELAVMALIDTEPNTARGLARALGVQPHDLSGVLTSLELGRRVCLVGELYYPLHGPRGVSASATLARMPVLRDPAIHEAVEDIEFYSTSGDPEASS